MGNPSHENMKNSDDVHRSKLGKRASKKREKDPYELQLVIAKHIIHNGIKSPHDTADELHISNQLANKTFNRMIKHRYLKCVKEKDVAGGTRKYYNFKEAGLKWILEKSNLDFDEFWKILFLTYADGYDPKKLESIDSVIKQFEKSKKISRNHFFPSQEMKPLSNPKYIINNDRTFYEKIKPFFNDVIYTENEPENDELLHDLDSRDLVTVFFDEKTKKSFYDFSPYGDILLLYFIYETLTKNINEINFDMMQEFTEKYPNVFNKWNLIKRITGLGDTSLLYSFLFLHVVGEENIFNNQKRNSETFGRTGYENDMELLRVFINMHDHMSQQFIDEFESAQKNILNWAKQNNALKILFNQYKFPARSLKILAKMKVDTTSKNQIKKLLHESYQENRRFLEFEDQFSAEHNELDRQPLSYGQEDGFLENYRSESSPNSKIIKKIMDSILPISKFAEIYNFMMPKDPELYLRYNTKKFFNNKIYDALYDIMSFQFYLILKLAISPQKWELLMSNPEMHEIKKWFNDWIDIIIDYQKQRLDAIKNEKDSNQSTCLYRPVYPETFLVRPRSQVFINKHDQLKS